MTAALVANIGPVILPRRMLTVNVPDCAARGITVNVPRPVPLFQVHVPDDAVNNCGLSVVQ